MIWRLNYAAHEQFIAPARESAALWRLVLGFTLAALGYVALSQMFFQVVYSFLGAQSSALYENLLKGSTPQAMYLLLFSFAFMTMAVGVTVRIVHRRSALGLLGDLRLALAQFGAVSAAMLGLMIVVFLLPPWDMGGDFVANMSASRWVILLPISLVAVLVQVSAEEIVFRGYVQQQLAARFRSPLVWMILPSVLFALGHYLPDTAGENALFIAVWAGLFGIMMADLTARAGTLGPAIALHLWNNVSAVLIVSLPDDLSGLALYLAPFGLGDTAEIRAWLPVDFVLMFVSWLAARLALRR
ncbi:CPBP family intramembrane glutamic endopeptidase [Sulfitobacter sp. MF3-043]|uniref:CPBP family intramembrane glutamic endopeptidase n=1 Tax=Sulfitobacter sediminivivens TaxID=3252902 RepID=UPI0036DBB9AD